MEEAPGLTIVLAHRLEHVEHADRSERAGRVAYSARDHVDRARLQHVPLAGHDDPGLPTPRRDEPSADGERYDDQPRGTGRGSAGSDRAITESREKPGLLGAI